MSKQFGHSLAHLRDFCADGMRATTLPRLGWAFLLTWVFCVFYTETLGDFSLIGTAQHSAGTLSATSFLFSCLPVAASVVTLVVLVACEATYGSPVRHRWTFWATPICAAVFTPVLLATSNYEPLLGLFVLGALGTGVGSGFLWVMWGECFARFSQEDTEFLAPLSAILAALITLIISAMSGWVPVALTTLLPLASGACLIVEWRRLQGTNGGTQEPRAHGPSAVAQQREHDEAAASGLQVLRPVEAANASHPQPTTFKRNSLRAVLSAMGRACFGILAACLFICLEGGFHTAQTATDIQLALIFSLLFMAVVGFTAISGPRRVSLSFLYRWMCPLMVAGFAAIIFDPTTGVVIAFAVGIAARFAFCLITQMYFARYSTQGLATPLQAYGLGWISVHLGDLLGVFAIMYAQAGIESGTLNIAQIAAIAIVLLVMAVMFALGGGKIPFNGQQHASEKTEEATRDEAPASEDAPSEALGEKDTAVGATAAEATIAQAATRTTEKPLAPSLADIAREANLTKREVEVFELLAQGRSVPYIRDALIISRETAATHTKHIYAKLGVHSRQELIDLVQQ